MQAPIKTDEEFEAVYEYIATMRRADMYRLLMQVSVKLGMRPVEIANFHTNWIRGRELRIPQGQSKGSASRTLPLNDELLEALAAYLQGRTGRVFSNGQGKPFTAKGISDAFQRLYERAGILGSCYSGRRTFATNMMDRSVPLPVISKALGHKSVNTTINYIGVTNSMLERAMFS